jgi:hypothetical protein
MKAAHINCICLVFLVHRVTFISAPVLAGSDRVNQITALFLIQNWKMLCHNNRFGLLYCRKEKEIVNNAWVFVILSKEKEIVNNAWVLEYIHVFDCFGTLPRQIIALYLYSEMHGRRYILPNNQIGVANVICFMKVRLLLGWE